MSANWLSGLIFLTLNWMLPGLVLLIGSHHFLFNFVVVLDWLLIYMMSSISFLFYQIFLCLVKFILEFLSDLLTFLSDPSFVMSFFKRLPEFLLLFENIVMDIFVFIDPFFGIEGSIAMIILMALKNHQSSLHHVHIKTGLFGFCGCFSGVFRGYFLIMDINRRLRVLDGFGKRCHY